MDKVIFYCADGTWSGPGDSDAKEGQSRNSNVYRLFDHLAGAARSADGAWGLKASSEGRHQRRWNRSPGRL